MSQRRQTTSKSSLASNSDPAIHSDPKLNCHPQIILQRLEDGFIQAAMAGKATWAARIQSRRDRHLRNEVSKSSSIHKPRRESVRLQKKSPSKSPKSPSKSSLIRQRNDSKPKLNPSWRVEDLLPNLEELSKSKTTNSRSKPKATSKSKRPTSPSKSNSFFSIFQSATQNKENCLNSKSKTNFQNSKANFQNSKANLKSRFSPKKDTRKSKNSIRNYFECKNAAQEANNNVEKDTNSEHDFKSEEECFKNEPDVQVIESQGLPGYGDATLPVLLQFYSRILNLELNDCSVVEKAQEFVSVGMKVVINAGTQIIGRLRHLQSWFQQQMALNGALPSEFQPRIEEYEKSAVQARQYYEEWKNLKALKNQLEELKKNGCGTRYSKPVCVLIEEVD